MIDFLNYHMCSIVVNLLCSLYTRDGPWQSGHDSVVCTVQCCPQCAVFNVHAPDIGVTDMGHLLHKIHCPESAELIKITHTS